MFPPKRIAVLRLVKIVERLAVGVGDSSNPVACGSALNDAARRNCRLSRFAGILYERYESVDAHLISPTSGDFR